MVIKRKDGNLYVLEGPNPIVKQQVSWDPEGLVFHNFSWDDITVANVSGRVSKKQETHETKVEHKVLQPTTEQPNLPESKPQESAPSPPTEDNRDFDLPYIKYKVLCYCLPATTKVHTDKLYGESWQRTTYGKKFVFPCVIIETSDISLQFWTSDPRRQIGEKSVIYPFSYEVHNKSTDSYDKVPYDEYRWWKVSERTEKEGGWLFSCIPSDTQPDFSD